MHVAQCVLVCSVAQWTVREVFAKAACSVPGIKPSFKDCNEDIGFGDLGKCVEVVNCIADLCVSVVGVEKSGKSVFKEILQVGVVELGEEFLGDVGLERFKLNKLLEFGRGEVGRGK